MDNTGCTEKRTMNCRDGGDLIGVKVCWNGADVKVNDVWSHCSAHRNVRQLKTINHIMTAVKITTVHFVILKLWVTLVLKTHVHTQWQSYLYYVPPIDWMCTWVHIHVNEWIHNWTSNVLQFSNATESPMHNDQVSKAI